MEWEGLSIVQEDCGALHVDPLSVLAVLVWHASNWATHLLVYIFWFTVTKLISMMPCIGAEVISVMAFGYGAGPMYSFSCSGTETALINCTLTSAGSCSYSYQAAVRCAG